MRTVQVYIEGVKLDLFDDEQINVTSTQQNTQDISKVYTDFSQSFSCPSTPNNDAIFQHFYNTDVDSTIDHNVRREGLIEIDLTTFRSGKIQLEKAEIKDNQAYSYQITFYGDITSLKDKFSDEKLIDLSLLSIYAHTYNGTEIENRIIDGSTNYVVRYPLITRRYLTYQDGGSNDIDTTTGAINYNELFPAIRLAAIFGAIEGRYGVTFEGTFFLDKRFQNCFLHCQNSNDFQYFTGTQDVDFTTGSTTSLNSKVYTDYFDLSTDVLTFDSTTFYDAFVVNPTQIISFRHIVDFGIVSVSDLTATWYVDVFVNDVLAVTLDGQSILEFQTYLIHNGNITTPVNIYYRVRANAAMQIDMKCTYTQEGKDFAGGTLTTYENIFTAETSVQTLTGNIDPIVYMPDMKVSDFFSAVLKEFNLTCYGLEKDVFQVEPLDDWYMKGAVVDITQYTDIKSINVDRIKLFSNIFFKYQQSENILNSEFRDLFNRDYGDAQIAFDYDGGEFKVEMPFENMHFQKFTGTDLQVGFTVNKDLQTYVPKPMLIYMYDETPASFKYYDGSTTSTLTEYMPFGQDVIVNNENYTLNFNAEISTFTGNVEQNTLFAVYYFPYLSNLFNLKNRRTTVKTNLPVSLLTGLKLNDRVIIRDKRYIIESMKSNLNTGDVDFVLINDFRELIADDGGSSPNEPLLPDLNAQCLDVRILFPNGARSAAVTTSDVGVTITPSSLTSDGIVEVCIPANSGTTTLFETEDGVDYINTEDSDRLRTEGGETTIYTIVATYTYADGSTVANNIFIQQQP